MTRYEWIGFQTLLKKECMRFWKVKGQTVFSPLVNAGLYLVVFGVSLSGVLKMHSEFSYLQFLIPGLVALSSLNNSLQNSASSIMISKFHGDLQDLRYIPLSHHWIGLAYVLACIVRGTFVGFLVLGMGELVNVFQSGELMPVAHPLGLLLFLTIGGAIFGNLGIWAGFLSKTFDHISSFTNFVILPLIYLGGVFLFS
jgi:ABC-2 type transport system permease protein